MIRHIVMFKLKEFATPADKQAKMQENQNRIRSIDRQNRRLAHDPRRF